MKRYAKPLKGEAPATSDAAVSAAAAKAMILQGSAPADMKVRGSLDLSDCQDLAALPAGLRVNNLNLRNCTALRSLPPGLRVRFRLILNGCTALERLPEDLAVGSLVMRGCTALRALPEGLDVSFLNIARCTGLEGWPASGRVAAGRLDASLCPQFRTLPAWLGPLTHLDVHGCVNLAELPEGLRVTSSIDLANTALRALPASLDGVQIRWRGVPIDARVAFHPETITAQEILDEVNVERRRVLLERMGYGTFLTQARAEVLDQDEDIGGERRLLRIALDGDEPLVCVALICPSTGRQYIIRVPPAMHSCHQAVAWMAGYSDPDDYHPIVET